MMLDLYKGPPIREDRDYEPIRRPPDNEILNYISFVRLFVSRRYKLMLLSVVCALFMSVAYLKVAPSLYTASATIDIVNRESEFVHQQASLAETPLDMQQEILVAKSPVIAEEVVKRLHLDQDPEFNNSGSAFTKRLKAAWSGPVTDPALAQLRYAVAAVQRKTKVAPVGAGATFEVAFSSTDGARAAEIANALADAFIEKKREADEEIHKKANDWMIDQSTELRQRAQDAEQAMSDFAKANNLVTVNGKLLEHQNLEDLNRLLASAKEKMIDAKYKVEKISASLEGAKTKDILNVTASPEILNDQSLVDLRTHYLNMIDQVNTIQRNFNRDSPQLRFEMATVKAQIISELSRLYESANADFQLASKHCDELESQINETRAASQVAGSLEGRLRQLQDTAKNYRTLSDSFLQHSAASIQEVSFPVRSARISDRALPPAERSWPKSGVVLAIGLLGGLVVGAAGGVLRDFSDGTFRTGAALEDATNLKCIGLIPICKISKRDLRGLALPSELRSQIDTVSRIPLWWKLLIEPNSRYLSELYGTALHVRRYANRHNARVVGVTSAVPGEGKSTLTVALAALLARSGQRVVVVDCDYRFPALTGALAPTAQLGLVDVLAGRNSLEDVSIRHNLLNITVVPGHSSATDFHPVEFLSSIKLKECITALRNAYDFVIVDLPPIVPIPDVRASAEFIEAYVFAVEWAKTSKTLIDRALQSYAEIQSRTLGAVLNKVDFKTLPKHDATAKLYYMRSDYIRYRNPD